MKRQAKWVLIFLLIIIVSGCGRPYPVKLPPVAEGWHKHAAVKNAYIVQKNDTLYSIAWAFGLDYRHLAIVNNLQSPYTLKIGQRIRIVSGSKFVKKQFTDSQKIKFNVPRTKPLKGWLWPTSGKVVAFFNSTRGNKGVDIAGNYGQAVVASNGGEVVYSGIGIRSYGKLIIIKHNDDYLSAYAYNKNMLVHEGDKITAGQKIATMGRDDGGHTRLHFEIRRFGKPINPLSFLPRKS